jgi:hypothetical protein
MSYLIEEKLLEDYREDLEIALGKEAWLKVKLANPNNYKKDTYYHINTKKDTTWAGVGEGLYLGRDKEALKRFYDPNNKFTVLELKGKPKFLDLTKKEDFKNFKDSLAKKGIKLENSNIDKIVFEMGYDGIKYYDPFATGLEFVLFNKSKLKLCF